MSYIVSLSVVTKPGEDGNAAFATFSDLAVDLQDQHAQVTVHSIDLEEDLEVVDEEEIEECFDEGTLAKVLEAIMTYVESEDDASEIITQMQNRGILFREIKK